MQHKIAITFLFTQKENLMQSAYRTGIYTLDFDWETSEGFLKLVDFLKEESGADNVIIFWVKELKNEENS